jgi:uncharacterized protein
MKVAVTGATGLIGRRLMAALRAQGDDVVALARRPDAGLGVETRQWDAIARPAPVSGVDAVVHLAGEPVAQRWSEPAKERIRTSRTVGTANLVAGIEAADPKPAVLVSTSASGYYGDRGSELLEESAPPGPVEDFLVSVCLEWERAAERAASFGVRVVTIRNGIVLDKSGGALKQMLLPFRAFVGGPVGGGRQYMPWIALDDVVGLYLAALAGGASGAAGAPAPGEGWSGPINAAAPNVATNADFSHALGRALGRPSVVPVPGNAVKLIFGDMASLVLGSQRMVPAKALGLGYEFRYPELDGALRAALA